MRPEPSANRPICAAQTCLQRAESPFTAEHSLAGRPSRGRRIIILDRSLVEAEWDMVRAFVQRMERNDLRLRFGRPLNLGDEVTLRKAFDIAAGVGEMAWALDEAAAIAAIAHRIRISRSEAEIGLIVRSDLKRRGIGEFLLRAMLARSAREGLKTVSASVMRDNHGALRLAAKVGYGLREPSALTVELIFDVERATAATG
jgi:GNAT superfamily N-acetyltransferase